MQKKIVMAAGLFPPDIGGPATYAAMIAKELPTKGFVVEVVPYGAVRSVPKLFRHLRYTQILFRATKDADAVFALDPMSVGWPALLVSRLRRIPLLVRLGGDYAWEQGVQRFGVQDTLDGYTKNQGRGYGLRVKMFSWLQSYVVARAALVVVPSEYLQSIVATWSKVKIDRIQVVYSALFPLAVTGTKTELRSQLEYTSPTLFSAGRLVPWKGMEKLVEVLVAVQQEFPEATLVIAGDGPEKDRINKLAREHGVASQVRLVGGLGKEALGASMTAADVFVLNTSYEGLSHTLLEAMDLGVPIVTTEVGGNPELVQDGLSGALVAVDDVEIFAERIIHIYTDQRQREKLIQNARLRVQDFSKEKSVDRLATLLKKYVS